MGDFFRKVVKDVVKEYLGLEKGSSLIIDTAERTVEWTYDSDAINFGDFEVIDSYVQNHLCECGAYFSEDCEQCENQLYHLIDLVEKALSKIKTTFQEVEDWGAVGFSIVTEESKVTVAYEGETLYTHINEEGPEKALQVTLNFLKVSGVYKYTLLNGEEHRFLAENIFEALNSLVYSKEIILHPSQITGIELDFVPIN